MTLEQRLAEATARGDHELAARLREEMQARGSKIRTQVPGQMGLGTSDQVMKPPPGWKPPKPPDLMTANTKARRGKPSR
jgi:hypothetical protein